MMVGQKKLLNTFGDFTLSTLPHSIMLVGDRGCGKHTLVSMLSDSMGIEIENISEKLTYDKISELSTRSLPYFYIVDGQVSENSQNSLLKFVEEPPSTAYVFILTESKECFLPTIVGRCRVYVFEDYTDEELKEFTDDLSVIKLARTPGKIKEITSKDSSWVFDLNNTILTKLSCASIPNTLSLLNKFDFGKEPNKFDINLEMQLLSNACIDLYRSTNDVVYLNAYLTTALHRKKFSVPNVDKQKLFALYLLDLKSCLKQNDSGRT